MNNEPNIGDRVVLTNNSYSQYGAYKGDIGTVSELDCGFGLDSIGIICDESINKISTNVLYVSEEDLELV